MQELTRRRAIGIGLRAKVPLLARVVALVLLASGIGFVGVSYYKLRKQQRFVAAKNPAELSKNITGIIEGVERQVTKNDRLYLLIKASRDITYSDTHHELENVSISVYPAVGEVPDFIMATRAVYQPETSIIHFLGNVKIETKDKLKVNTEALSLDQNTEVAQTDSPVAFERENVAGRATGAVVEQKVRKLELKSDVEITVSPRAATEKEKSSPKSKPVTIKAAHAIFEHESLKLSFSGGVTAEQEASIMSGDTLNALLNQQKQLENVEVRGNAYLRTMEPRRAAEVHGVDMDFHLDKDQKLERAQVRQDVRAATLDSDSEMKLSGSQQLEVLFQSKDDRSLLREMNASGRSVITLSAPKSKLNDSKAANKRLTADSVKLMWRLNGGDLDTAEAKGNAELFVDPVARTAGNESKTLTAAQFNCVFFEAGNLTKNCNATGGAKAVLDPVQPNPNRGTRTITSQSMNAAFVKDTQDLERLDAQGDAKFNENDRNGIAATASYVAAEQTVKLRGGEPTVWDSRGRTKGTELDSDLAQ